MQSIKTSIKSTQSSSLSGFALSGYELEFSQLLKHIICTVY